MSTNQKVGDETAARFTQEFYKNLFSGRTYKDAFDDAIAAIISAKQKEKVSKHRGAFDLGECPESDTEYVLLTKEAGTDEFSFADLLNNPYFGLPKLLDHFYDQLPKPSPYLALQHYTEDEAPLFFGRGGDIRELYKKITETTTKTVLLYGLSGVGKSSLLHAGLLPYLVSGGYSVQYERRRSDVGLTVTLRDALECTNGDLQAAWENLEQQDKQPLIVILDQVEEALTNYKHDEINELAEAIRTIFNISERGKRTYKSRECPIRGKLILGYREEYHAQIDDVLQQHPRIPYERHLVKPLSQDSIREIVEGVPSTPKLHEKYKLSFAPDALNLPQLIADKIGHDSIAAVSPVLQILLTDLWERATFKGGERLFTLDSFKEITEKKGIGLDKFIHEQFAKIEERFEGTVASGLVLDLLNYFVTELGTAGSRSWQEVEDRYAIDEPNREANNRLMAELLNILIDTYLLQQEALWGGPV